MGTSEEQRPGRTEILGATFDPATGGLILHSLRGRVVKPAEFRRMGRQVRRFYRGTDLEAIDEHNREAAAWWGQEDERRAAEEERRAQPVGAGR
jgi:hypothetical protein